MNCNTQETVKIKTSKAVGDDSVFKCEITTPALQPLVRLMLSLIGHVV